MKIVLGLVLCTPFLFSQSPDYVHAPKPLPLVQGVQVPKEDMHLSQRCWSGEGSRDECSVRWTPTLVQSGQFLAILTAGNIVKDEGLRIAFVQAVREGKFIDNWLQSLSNYRWTRWSQDAPWKDDYVGHPMMGAITNYIWIQNDPYGQTMQWENSREYWYSRLRALPLTTAFSFQWKLGPISEASIGNAGIAFYRDPHSGRWTNDTGVSPLVTTPVGGLLWTVGEDILDKKLVPILEAKSRNPLYLFVISFANPARSFSNMMQFKAPWYRPYRHVKASWRKNGKITLEIDPPAKDESRSAGGTKR
jgi:hypothetical protein